MVSLRLKLILAALVFFLFWNFLLAPRVYTWLDTSDLITPPIAFTIVFSIYFGCFTLIFLGLVEGNLQLLSGSVTLAILTALGVLNIDIAESTIPISPDGSLLTGSLGWKSDISVLYWHFWSFLGIPKELMFFFIMFVSPAMVFTLIILTLTTNQVRQYWQEIRF